MTADLVIAPETPNRRALILPGGGMRVAYQAGALKALHDSGLRFSYADGASGGTMNLASLMSGVSPETLCRNWRSLRVTDFVALRPWRAYLKFPAIGALGGLSGLRDKIFPHLGVDIEALRRASSVSATFNVCNFDEKIVYAVPQGEMSLDLLLAGVSLPLVTPPVYYHGATYTDAVWIQDCNLLAPVRAGANELWVIWCIGNTPEFKTKLIEQYVHMIEMSALGALHRQFAEIAALNAAIARGERPYGQDRTIVVHFVKPVYPLPLDPDFLAGRIDAPTLVDSGYRDASRYLAAMTPDGIALAPASTRMKTQGFGINFREAMTGRLTFGATDPQIGYKDPAAVPFMLRASIDIRDIGRFVFDRTHTGELTGHLYAPRAGFTLPGMGGVFRLFAPTADAKETWMVYEIAYLQAGRPYYLAGRKRVRVGPPWLAWAETTTLYVTLHEGGADGPVCAAGILRLGVFDLLALLGTLHATGCETPRESARAIWRFAAFFIRELWRTYVLRRPLAAPRASI
ncbi:patatin-like phospholipase family protein [Acidisoma cellulosilytica]|uniref:Patatin-like phospholipase family protein n=1 Tax=Acidisoma cellulosilyticum TaxID=2802395 RepID=A0A963Z5T9_9PROT|nr:patatin-like phospholipase family protein [Acidisoma cellulosilyticum]MCB8883071.1 patatin-like phospholipase family protein [Acidisoma cellulosilyticum]